MGARRALFTVKRSLDDDPNTEILKRQRIDDHIEIHIDSAARLNAPINNS